MTIPELISQTSSTAFSFEVLPPLKGNSMDGLRATVDKLREFDPKYINITTHSAEYIFRERKDNLLERQRIRRRPGTVAVAAALQQEYGIPVVPHILCGGFTRSETEYALIDLQFLGISNILALRGDKAQDDKVFRPTPGGNAYTTELIQQINDYNAGTFADGTPIKDTTTPFSYGVACYPEKHEEAPNLDSDFRYFKEKIDLGADYGVTQMFFDNAVYFRFVERARAEGIDAPIIPGIKPLTRLNQLVMLPKMFHCDLPETLMQEARRCQTDEQFRALGREWAIAQCRELIAAGVPSIHFYSMGAADAISDIAKEVY